jgi:uncharacterized protein YciI
MHFVIIAVDKPGTKQLRLDTRPAHRDYLHGHHDKVTLKLAGPMLAPDNDTMVGSLLVVDAPDLAAAEAFSAGDPYRKAGLFADLSIRPWNWVTGNPEKA